jgi:hypothetical protein
VTTYPLTIWTIDQQLENGYTVDQMCPRGHGVRTPVDLKALSAAGFGDKPVRSLNLKCNFCESCLVFTIHPSPRFAQTIESSAARLPVSMLASP